MALTITTDLTTIALGNATADTDANWLDIGGGGSAAEETDYFIEGATCYSRNINTTAERGFWYDIGSGNELDFSTTGTEENMLIYIWVQTYIGGALDTLANGGFAIRLGTTTTDYEEWNVGGSDFPPEGDEFFKIYVIDPTTTSAVTGGSGLTLSSIRYFGAVLDPSNSTKGQTLGIDAIRYGRGELIATGTQTTTGDGFGEMSDGDWGTISGGRYGIIRERDGILFVNGKLKIGDDSGTNSVVFTSQNETLVWETPWYYDGTNRVQAVPDEDEDGVGYWGLEIVGNGTGDTTCTFGTQVGSTEFGRSGSSFSVASNPNINSGEARQEVKMAHTSAVEDFDMFGCTFSNFTTVDTAEAVFDFSNLDSNDLCYSNSFNSCGLIDPGAGVWRNDFFISADHTATQTGQLLWLPGTTDVEDCQFIDYGFAAIYEPDSNAGAGDTWTGLVFDLTGTNELNYDDSENQTITIVDGTAAASLTSTDDGAGTTTFTGAVNVDITVVDLTDTPIQNARVGIFATSDGTQIMNELTNASGFATESYTGSTPRTVTVRIRKSSPADNPRYLPLNVPQTIGTGGLDAKFAMSEDPNVV